MSKQPLCDGFKWDAEGPPHWFKVDEFADGRLYLDYWRWDGTNNDEARFWAIRVDSRETAQKLIEKHRSTGLDLHPQSVEYRPNEVMPELAVVTA